MDQSFIDEVKSSPIVAELTRQLIDAANTKGQTVDANAIVDIAIADATKGIQNPVAKEIAVAVSHCLIAKTLQYFDTHEAHTGAGRLLRKVFGFLYPHHASSTETATVKG